MDFSAGVMLRRLLTEPNLESLSHIVLDEVHERTIESDLLLFLLRDLLLSGKELWMKTNESNYLTKTKKCMQVLMKSLELS